MAVERTLSIVKPDAVAKNVIGEIVTRFEKAGLQVVAAKMIKLDDEKAGGFYAEHKERPFFKDLVSFMTSGPCCCSGSGGETPLPKPRTDGCHQSQRKRLPALSALTSLKASMPTQYTVPDSAASAEAPNRLLLCARRNLLTLMKRNSEGRHASDLSLQVAN